MAHIIEHKGNNYYPVQKELFVKNAHNLVPYIKVSQIINPQNHEKFVYLVE